jgi:membrane protein implicated in regulation of membrane protease activity
MLFGVCAIVGGVFLVGQFILTLTGLGGDMDGHDSDVGGHDVHHDAAHDVHEGSAASWFVGVLTFRTIVAALTFFGLMGLAGTWSAWDPALTLALSLAAGAASMFLLAYLMRSMHRLNADGSARIERALGQSGTVYLTVPGQRSGAGKVSVSVQNRTMEYRAVTSQHPLTTGTKVVVVAVVGPDTVEVASAAHS